MATYEFYAPFAHIPGRYELARIHSTTHGSFDTWIIIESTTDQPVTVYVNEEKGLRFMTERYPESTAILVPPECLVIESDGWSRTVTGNLIPPDSVSAAAGPIAEGHLVFTQVGKTSPTAVPYGGEDFAVWGSRFTCSGVDMEVPARVHGELVFADGTSERFGGAAGIITLGSYGMIEERHA